jgi:alpha-amylase
MRINNKYFYYSIIIVFVFCCSLFVLFFSACGSSSSTDSNNNNNDILSTIRVSDTFVFANNTTDIILSDYIDYYFENDLSYSLISYPSSFAFYDTNTGILSLSPAQTDTGEYKIELNAINNNQQIIADAFFYIDVFDSSSYTVSPNDWREKNIYFLMVDRFNDGDPSNNTANGEYAPSVGDKIHGGDIRGVIDKLDYIQNLGFKSIWMTPVLKNYNAYHGYHIWDFKKIDPHFGTLEEYKELVREAHSRGMSVIMDIVTNHSADLIGNTSNNYSWNYPQGYTLRYHNENRKHKPDYLALLDYFYNYGSIENWNDPIQSLKGDFVGLDAFRTDNQKVKEYMAYFYAWWILHTDIDGFRIDTVKHVEFSFWEYFLPYIRNVAKQIGKDNFFMFGEVWHSSDEVVGKYTGTKNNPQVELFESITYFPMYDTIKDVFRNQQATNKISDRISSRTYYDTSSRDKLVTFIDNHDVERFIHNFGNDASIYHPHLKLAYFFISTFQGINCLYYGTEQGFDGGQPEGQNQWNRENMWEGEWNYGPSLGYNFNENHELYLFIKEVNEKIDENIWIKTAEFTELKSDTEPGIYAFSRHNNDSEAIVVLNNSNDAKNINLEPLISNAENSVYYNIFDNNDIITVSSENNLDITISALDYKIFIKR